MLTSAAIILVCIGCVLAGYGVGYERGKRDAEEEARRIARALWDEEYNA